MVQLEKYDYPETATQQEIWRNYIVQMVGLFIFMIVNYKGVYDLSVFDEYLGTNFKRFDSEQALCKYDQAGISFITLAFTEIGTLALLEVGKALARYLFFYKLLK